MAGTGVVGVGIGAVFGLKAESKLGQSNDGPCDASDHCSAEGLSLRHEANSAAAAATIAFAAGAVAIATGLVIYLTAPRTATTGNVAVSPSAAPGTCGAILRATF